jgi:hypothetical protein
MTLRKQYFLRDGSCDHDFVLFGEDGYYECDHCGFVSYGEQFETGAAVAFGLMGMALAIQEKERMRMRWEPAPGTGSHYANWETPC